MTILPYDGSPAYFHGNILIAVICVTYVWKTVNLIRSKNSANEIIFQIDLMINTLWSMSIIVFNVGLLFSILEIRRAVKIFAKGTDHFPGVIETMGWPMAQAMTFIASGLVASVVLLLCQGALYAVRDRVA